jgi:phage baseplate assembly protein W
MAFTKQVPAFRTLRIHAGDTLQKIALREMGSAERWRDLIYLNNLSYPYIVADAAAALGAPGTLYYGQQIRVPAATSAVGAVTDAEELFGKDVSLSGGVLAEDNGDFAVERGIANFHQAIQLRLDTDPGDLMYHPDYGCHVRSVIGEKHTPTWQGLANGFVQRALLSEPRVRRVLRAAVESAGDTIRVEATVIPIQENTAADLNLVIGGL